MIDLNKAKNVFFEYIKNYDETESNISVKKYHSLRVMENAIAIAKDLKLSQEDIELAGLIGLLHDTARFEQWKRFNNFSDKKTGFDKSSTTVIINMIMEMKVQKFYQKTIF